MTDSEQGAEKRDASGRWWPGVLGLVVLAVIAIVIAVAVVGGNTSSPDPTPTPSETSAAATETTTASPSPSSAEPVASAEAPVPSDEPVPFDADAALGTELGVRLIGLESVQGEASQPGEVAGPSVRFSVEISNPGSEAISLESVAVNAYYGADRVPAILLQEPGGSPFPQTVGAGGSVQGVYVFSIPDSERDTVTLTVDLASQQAQTIFSGVAPR